MTQTYGVTAERNHEGWHVVIAGVAPHTCRFTARDLGDVEPRALRIIRTTRGHHDVRLDLKVVLPAPFDARHQRIAALSKDLDREIRSAHDELIELGLSPLDSVRVLRRWGQTPRSLTVTSGEVASAGLTRHPTATGLVWDDHGQFQTTRCRRCVEDDLAFYRYAPPDEEHALIYEPLTCDFCDQGTKAGEFDAFGGGA